MYREVEAVFDGLATGVFSIPAAGCLVLGELIGVL